MVHTTDIVHEFYTMLYYSLGLYIDEKQIFEFNVYFIKILF